MQMAETAVATETPDAAEVLEGRAAFYEMLAALFFTPLTQDQIDAMAMQDFSAYEGVNEMFDAGINDVTRYLRKRHTGTRQELACDFTSAFAGTKTFEGHSAVPYESVFTSEDGLLCQGAYHEVYATYKRSRLRKREGLDFPEDHLSFLCEYLAVLSRRALQKLEADDCAGALEDLAASKEFLDDHVLSWYGAFDERARKIIQTRFYRGVLSIAGGFFAFDRQVLDDLMEVCG